MPVVLAEAGSFRDPAGQIFHSHDRVFRTVMPLAAQNFDAVRSTGLIDELIGDGKLIRETVVDKAILGDDGTGATYALEHPKLPFISYPYEWSFEGLKTAALLHLEIQQAALRKNVALTDATAYNIQFIGPKPIFIDSLSFRPYEDGEYWSGHRQFCEQFVNPLLLRSIVGLTHNAWFRGTLEGISAAETARVLPWYSRFSWNAFTHVFLQARLQRSSAAAETAADKIKSRRLPKLGHEQILHSLHRWIGKLQPKSEGTTVWSEYAHDNSYANDEEQRKRAFVANFIDHTKPGMIFDVGCNTGDYSALALEHGVELAIGFDFDHGALDAAFRRARKQNLNFLPLHLDAANPSPAQGWLHSERQGFQHRAKGDALLALALIHHLAIARNLPLQQVVKWLVSMAPQGVLEFIPKTDPMVQRLLSLREDLFDHYDKATFEKLLGVEARIVQSESVSSSGRTLFWYDRE